MQVRIESVHLGDIKVVAPEIFGDARGFFMEAYRADQFRELGLPAEFVQENHSRSDKGVLRGLHFQWEPPMGKLMRVVSGEAFVVAVDIRKGSPTLGRWHGMVVSAENKKQVWAPYGFARGFCALTDGCEVLYKCTGIYNAKCESGIHFGDPAIGIDWPMDISAAKTSDRDRHAQSLTEWLKSPNSDRIVYRAERIG